MCVNKNNSDNELKKALAEAEAEVVKAKKAFKEVPSTKHLKDCLRAEAKRDILKVELSKKSEN